MTDDGPQNLRLTVRLDPQTMGILRAAADSDSSTPSEVARRLLRQAVDRMEAGDVLHYIQQAVGAEIDRALELRLAPLHGLAAGAAQQSWAAARMVRHTLAVAYALGEAIPNVHAHSQEGMDTATQALATERDGGRTFVETLLPGAGDLADDGTEPLS